MRIINSPKKVPRVQNNSPFIAFPFMSENNIPFPTGVIEEIFFYLKFIRKSINDYPNSNFLLLPSRNCLGFFIPKQNMQNLRSIYSLNFIFLSPVCYHIFCSPFESESNRKSINTLPSNTPNAQFQICCLCTSPAICEDVRLT